MATNKIIETGSGFVSGHALRAGADGKLDEGAIISLSYQLEGMRRAINGGLTFGTSDQSSRAGNFDAQTRTVRFTTADTEVQIPHGLGRIPVGFIVTLPDRACTLYAANLGGWGEKYLYLKCDTSAALVQIIVF